jgi:GNAT superfamily N-acetyltransferase
MGGVTLRTAKAGDIADVASIFARSRAAALPFLPVLHGPDEDIAFFGGYLTSGLITLLEEGGAKLGFLVESPGWIEHLYLEPNHRGRGLGKLLIEAAKSRQDRLLLWCFRDNLAARAFYAREGFLKIGQTDGDNEAGLPDVLLLWQNHA